MSHFTLLLTTSRMRASCNGVSRLPGRARETGSSAIAIIVYRRRRRRERPPWPPIIRVRSLSSNSVAGAALVPRLRNQDGIEKGISRLQLKLPTSISISAPIYSHRPYKRVCSYIGFPLSHTRARARTHTHTHTLFLYRLLSLSLSPSILSSLFSLLLIFIHVILVSSTHECRARACMNGHILTAANTNANVCMKVCVRLDRNRTFVHVFCNPL